MPKDIIRKKKGPSYVWIAYALWIARPLKNGRDVCYWDVWHGECSHSRKDLEKKLLEYMVRFRIRWAMTEDEQKLSKRIRLVRVKVPTLQIHRAIMPMGARLPCKETVKGSTPLSSTGL